MLLIDINSTSTTSLSFVWRFRRSLPVYRYIVYYFNMNNTYCFNDTNTTHTTETIFTMNGLQEDTMYFIKVTVLLSNGNVGANNNLMATTLDDGMYS